MEASSVVTKASSDTDATIPLASASQRPPSRQKGVSVPARQRSRITNGSQLLPGVKNTNVWARRCRDVIDSYLSDHPDASVAERSIIRRIAVLTTELERLESKFALAEQADQAELDLYQRTTGNLRRLLESIGLKREQKDVGPTLGQLLRSDLDRKAVG